MQPQLIRSDSIEDTKLAYYIQTIPSTVPGGFCPTS